MNHAGFIIVWRMVLAGVTVIGSVACLVPSAMMNLEVRGAMEDNLPGALACIGAVAMAALMLLVAEISIKNRAFYHLLWCLPVFVLMFGFNLWNATSLAGAKREAFTAPRITVVQTMKALKSQLRTVKKGHEKYDKLAGGWGPDVIETEISKQKLSKPDIWRRTKECALSGHGRWRSDSQAFCEGIADLRQKLAASKKAEIFNFKIAALNDKILALPVVTETDHPAIASIMRVYSTFWPEADNMKARFQIGSDIFYGVVVEALAAFGPIALKLLLWPASLIAPAPAARARQRREPAKPESGSVSTFLSESITVKRGAHVPSSDLYGSFKLWCVERGIEPITLTAFGKQAGKVYQKKRIDNRTAYLDIELRERLKLVAS